MGRRRFGQIIRKKESRRDAEILQRRTRQLRTGETGEGEVVNTLKRKGCVCMVVTEGLLGQGENRKE